MKLFEILADFPMIAAVRNEQDLQECFKTQCRIIFILYGSICNITEIVKQVKTHGKIPIVHMDFVSGMTIRDVSVEFILRNAGADGIVSTKPNLVKEAQKQGFIAIQRTFLVDSIALNSLEKQVELSMPSAIEIMPGIMPDIIRQVKHAVNIPVISGGLLSEKKHVITALSAGADAVSTTNHALWYA